MTLFKERQGAVLMLSVDEQARGLIQAQPRRGQPPTHSFEGWHALPIYQPK